jgi:hypothetical protein
MRSRIISDPSFSGDRILATIFRMGLAVLDAIPILFAADFF